MKNFYNDKIREIKPLIATNTPTNWKKLKKIFLEISKRLIPASKSITPIKIVGSNLKHIEVIKVNKLLNNMKRAK